MQKVTTAHLVTIFEMEGLKADYHHTQTAIKITI